MSETANTHGPAMNPVVGKVFILYGKVKAVAPDGTVRVLAVNSPVFAMDRIVTESDGSVAIMFDGPPPAQIEIGRMSDVLIDEDVYAGATPEQVAEATAEVEEIRALLEGEGEIELEAPAAGGTADSGGGHPVYVATLTANEVAPDSGAETIGPADPGTVEPFSPEGLLSAAGIAPSSESEAPPARSETPPTESEAPSAESELEPGLQPQPEADAEPEPEPGLAPAVEMADVAVVEGQDAEFTVTIENAAAGSTVTLVLADGTAVNADYNETHFQYSNDGGTTWNDVTGAIGVLEGDTTLLLKTDTVDDMIDENDETFGLTATLSSGGDTYSDTATATIEDNDQPQTQPPTAIPVNASGPEATTIEIQLSGTDTDGTVSSYTLTSLPTNGTLYTDAARTTVADTGTAYTNDTLYFVANQLDHFSSDPIQTSFNYYVTDNDELASEPATVKINVGDTAPNAADDYDETDTDGFDRGNVITGEAPSFSGADDLGADPTTVTSVTHGSSSVTPDADGEAIEGDYGKLIIESDGDYTYQHTTTVVNTGNFTDSSISLYGYLNLNDILTESGDLDMEVLNLSTAGQNLGVIEGSKSGIGITGGPGTIENGEAVLFDIGNNVTKCSIELSNFNENQGDDATWRAYDESGQEIASGDFTGSFKNGVHQPMAVETAEEFRYLIITDSATNQGIAISKIEFDVVGEDVFEYTISDTDGDFDTAYLTIDSSTLLDDDTDV